MHTQLQVLRGKIRGLQLEGLTINKHIRNSKGVHRHEHWLRKRLLGKVSREHLIAYALLRGVEYHTVEKCGEFNWPDCVKVFDIVQQHGTWKEKQALTQEKLREYLQPPAKEEK